jgi:hypothetical protein
MIKILQLVLISSLFISCTLLNNENQQKNNLDEVYLGMTVESVLEKLDIDISQLSFVQEPPFIYRAITATLKDSTEIGISFERTLANIDDLSKETGLSIVSKLKINGFAWKNPKGESKILGNRPQFWLD